MADVKEGATPDPEDGPPDLRAALIARLKAIPEGQVSATARRAGVTLRQLMRLRRGESADVRLTMLARLAHGLKESPAEVFGVAGKAVPKQSNRHRAELGRQWARAFNRIKRGGRQTIADVEKLEKLLVAAGAPPPRARRS